MAKDAFYFPHDYNSRTDQKMIKLIKVHGWQAYGIYWALIEKMHEAGGELVLDLENLAFDLRIEASLIDSILNNFELFRIKAQKITCERVKRNLKNRKQKSEKARESASKRWGYEKHKFDANAMPTQCEGNARKERKGKEIKERKVVWGFTPPTLSEVQAYCQERKNFVDPQRWHDFYSAKGWMVGKNKMKDWQAAVRTWEKDAQPTTPSSEADKWKTPQPYRR